MASSKYQLILPNGQTVDLNILTSTMGQNFIDAKELTKNNLGLYDPGFKATAACSSKITYIDGEKGILLYRGYPIEELSEKFDYLTTCYLLWYGDLPTPEKYENFCEKIKIHTLVHENIRSFFQGFPYTAHPMSMMQATVGALSAFYHESTDIQNPRDREGVAIRLIAKVPTIAAMAYKYSVGQTFIYPDNKLSYIHNFLRMLFVTPANPDFEIPDAFINAMEKIFILHADHEQNASTATVRLAGSSKADPYACIAAGIAALWGPAHGGANEAVLNMLDEIGSIENIPKYIAKAKDKNDNFRLMGFGHRVYKNYDPRSKIMRKCCHDVLKYLGKEDSDPLLEIAQQLEEIALKDEYFIERKLYPNVDFYSGITLKAMGIPVSLFTVIFATARSIGWISHWNEMISESIVPIGRPQQLYNGPVPRTII